MARVEVKICGICRATDARLAALAGADYVGVILSPSGPRAQDADSAAAIYGAAGDARRVGVFVDASVVEVRWLASRLRLDVAQLHGEEPPEVARALRAGGLEVWKAVRVHAAVDVGVALAMYGGAVDALLLDGFVASRAGGSGTRFAWAEAAAAW
ncbi:MAG: phosphoribosylanthranilate isomerase, partial [Longimicrobiales bacterium]